MEAETAKAQIQARDVAKIQHEVGEKQRSTEADLSKVNIRSILLYSIPLYSTLFHFSSLNICAQAFLDKECSLRLFRAG